jgi:hypothetical protein
MREDAKAHGEPIPYIDEDGMAHGIVSAMSLTMLFSVTLSSVVK